DIIARNSKSKAITPDLPIEEPDNSLSMGDEHLDTTPSIENLVPIPSEFEGISDDTSDVPNCDNNRVNVEIDFVESLIDRDTSIVHSSKIDPILEEFAGELAHIAPIPPGIVKADFDPNDDTSSDDDDFEDIEYVSFEEVNYVEQEEKEFVTDSDSSDTFLSHSDNSLPEFESFSDHTEETRSGSTTTYANYSLPEYESFHFDNSSFPRLPQEPPDVENLEPEFKNFDRTIPSHLPSGLFSHFSPTLRFLFYLAPPGVKIRSVTPASPLRASGISSGWNFHEDNSTSSKDALDYVLDLDDEVFPAEEQPLPAADSPTHQSPGYIPESDPEEDLEEDDEEDPEEDPADYPADRGDDDDDDAEEEEHLAPADPAAVAYSADQDPYLAYRVTARMSIRTQVPAPFLSEKVAERVLALPTPPPSPLSPYIPSPLL
ncbi:hypothetical protein Tco_0339360, partial [Tanacetum coccineum]